MNYTLNDSDGANGISESTGLTKNYGGSLTLNGFNSYTGVMMLNGGALFLNSNGAIAGTSGVTINASSLNIANGIGFTAPVTVNSTTPNAIVFNTGSPTSSVTFPNAITLGAGAGASFNVSQGSVAISGPVSGPGGITVNTTGVVNLTGSATYGGNTVITGGALQISNVYNPTNTATGNLGFGSAAPLLLINGTANFNGPARVDLAPLNTGNFVVNSGSLFIKSALGRRRRLSH